ncbi:lipopolysaccharide transport system ATP-binding protein [Tistlia consotensis]|uniref:Lipopolysaccharide transport system ATP-binding protein n=1 Tax=Tistlia consotensis USBA 355 TaxID=560819 RepID=A0A1Y6CK44_9PROT|nr:ABC transporter ATP-binding protein [Tistlia consotensis]SMF71774.1 lipopolysaccharide transport system ATP-binding protein [Tistlia consotensis USBA 355]SNS06312.1 lipopolysaccharide transport system ATP-binding protein [Tistlia consotensis]
MAQLAARGISVDFPLYHSETRSLRRAVLDRASGRFGADARRRPIVRALRDISFSLASGDRLGLVGSNGSGKTTLLRVLSGIYQPTAGSLAVDGSLASLLDPGQAMNPDMTGRENIRLHARFHRMAVAEIGAFEADVESFADIGAFLDLPVRNYSSGMMVRLSFAMATAARPEILLMDEWILAGDATFMDKARQRTETMVRHADILVLASHSAQVMVEWCNRLVWLEQGRVRADGEPLEVLSRYLPPQQFEQLRPKRSEQPEPIPAPLRSGTSP